VSSSTLDHSPAGLSRSEFDLICERLGREPNPLELAMFGVMWSEHCSYKNSRALLKTLPTGGSAILQGPGENAGIVDIGKGLAVVMKVESHNHPSAVEPYQGAATGVGGIIRDIFTMGARPIALLNSLRFGELDKARTRYLFENVVKGIGDYGNCMGIPTVAGEIYFDDHYTGNPLVNAMCVGIMRHEEVKYARAKGVGNPVMLVGATTGRDGMGGAAFASVELTEQSLERKSAVQVGDPFMEKLLLEACIELFKTDAAVAIQDLGAAGLTSSCCEMASRGRSGIRIELSCVPRREEAMTPVEIMLSESQERMLVVVKRGREKEVGAIFEKWGLSGTVIGEVTDDGLFSVLERGKVVASLPARLLADDAPIYTRESTRPAYLESVGSFDLHEREDMKIKETLIALLARPTIAGKEWVYRQYDHMVRTSTVTGPGSDAAVLRIRGTDRAIALTIDGNGSYCYLDPFRGAAIAVAEAARNLVCSGARPLAITDGLNFGNPEKREIYWQFKEAIAGLAAACNILETPVISGNVSFYNETETGAIFPTPIVGMVGVIEDISKVTGSFFISEGDVILLLGENTHELGGSEYLRMLTGKTIGECPAIDLEREKGVQRLCLEAIGRSLLNSAHDCSEGGLAVALSECCFGKGLGAKIELNDTLPIDALLFGEAQSRIVVSLEESKLDSLLELAGEFGVPAQVLGRVDRSELKIDVCGREVLSAPVGELEARWRGAIECAMRS
jgi:phosphoribosylformylglycinamidine synthase